jgi:hypothetical protein
MWGTEDAELSRDIMEVTLLSNTTLCYDRIQEFPISKVVSYYGIINAQKELENEKLRKLYGG